MPTLLVQEKPKKVQPKLFGAPKAPTHMGFVRRGLAVLVALSGVLSILASTRFLHQTASINIWFVPSTAWFSQHNIIVGFMFLYLARQIYLGERTAYRLTVGLMLLQVIKFSIFEPRVMAYSIYASLLIILLLSKDYFVRHSSPRHFVGRLKAVIFAVVGSVIAIALLGAIFRLAEPEVWRKHSFSATRIVMRVTLLEINTDKDDPLVARLFGQILSAAGFAMYAWILAGLFSPALYSRSHTVDAERESMSALLNEYGRTSEDSFKLWPEDKQYWFNSNSTAGIAFKQHKGFVIALEAPVGSSRVRERAASSFLGFCRQKGWKLVWLFADENIVHNNGLRTLKIGASAVVNLKQFATETVGNKWWRWIRNKNRKLGLHYEQLRAPYSNEMISEITEVSDAWLGTDKHSEWSFALGYYDVAFMQKCILHVLKNDNGKIVAFANQLPTYHNNSQATIDLMRSLPDYDGAVTYLLSEALINLHEEGRFKTFDLGFVPLAQNEEAPTKKALISLTKTLFNAYFSARGLRQFKNKFEPTWHDNYLAWDGDWLDVPGIAQAMDKVLSLETVDSKKASTQSQI